MTLAYSDSIFNAYYNKHPDIASGNISGNGNDGYFLYSGGNHNTGTLVDAYGVINQNGTGTEWQYEDSRAYRIYSVAGPDSVWHAREWVIVNATTSEVTPRWHQRTLTWTGTVSSEVNNKTNWEEADGSQALYPPDAGCKLIITANGNAPVISANTIFSTIQFDTNAILTISNNATLEIAGE